MLNFLDNLARSLKVGVAIVGMALSLPTLVRAQDIVIGQIGPFTGIPVPDAIQINQGIKAYVAQVNKAGGVRGRKISFFELDDKYTPDEFVKQFAVAMSRKPVALISPVGSASIKRMLDDKLLDKYDVVVMNGVPGAESLRNPGHPNFFHVRAGDKQEVEKMVSHARTLGLTKLAVLHQDIPVGTSAMKMVVDEVAKFKDVQVKGFQSTTDPKVMAGVSAELVKYNPQGVLVLGAPPFMANGVAQLRKAGVVQSIFVRGDAPAGLIVKMAGNQGARGVGSTQSFPDPNGKTKGLLRDFQAAMQLAFPDIKSYASFQLEGYLSARIVGEGLKRAKEIKPAALAKALQSMGEVDFDGYRVDFSKGNAGSHFVDIAVIDIDGRLRY